MPSRSLKGAYQYRRVPGTSLLTAGYEPPRRLSPLTEQDQHRNRGENKRRGRLNGEHRWDPLVGRPKRVASNRITKEKKSIR